MRGGGGGSPAPPSANSAERSSTRTLTPLRVSANAVDRPPMPPPTTMTSGFVEVVMIPVNAPEWVLGHARGEEILLVRTGRRRGGAGEGAGTAVAGGAESRVRSGNPDVDLDLWGYG